jgi:hypothetical protein
VLVEITGAANEISCCSFTEGATSFFVQLTSAAPAIAAMKKNLFIMVMSLICFGTSEGGQAF